jgi:hypothetical protein
MKNVNRKSGLESLFLSKTSGIPPWRDFEDIANEDRPKSKIRLRRGWPEVANPPSLWWTEMPRCQVILDPALKPLIIDISLRNC